jgi:hypothetical protein
MIGIKGMPQPEHVGDKAQADEGGVADGKV